MSQNPQELETLYRQRFTGQQEYRIRVWRVLLNDFFRKFVASGASVLDLGCGYGEFINNVECAAKYGMDLNADTGRLLAPEVRFLYQDCSATWPLPDNCLDVVFTSNFFEHLPDKPTLAGTLRQAHRCLTPGGRLIAMGPNIKYLPGAYWDFWDHHLPLTEKSLSEALRVAGFAVELCHPRFLPYTMVDAPRYPVFLLRLYLAVSWVWPLVGRQFLVTALCRKGDETGAGGLDEREKD